MRQIDDKLWVHEDSMRLLGAPLAIRMTVVALADGGLWVHDPTPLSPALVEATTALGPVRHIVGASNGHNNWLVSWQAAFPEATVYVADRIPKKRPRLVAPVRLRDVKDPPWREALDQIHMAGVPLFDEHLFLHRESRSLLVTDFVQNHTGVEARGLARILTKLVFEPIGYKGICIAPPLKMRFVVKDRPALCAALERLWQWEFDRVIVAHGPIVEDGAKQTVRPLFERFDRAQA